ncbi:MAG: hypothetical protein HEP71_30640 [Roseivirga sp.]|nr:hypothetical protein [Roseivirga sp.]
MNILKTTFVQLLIIAGLNFSAYGNSELYRINVIEMEMPDGHRLYGTLYETKVAGPGVIMFPPCGADRWGYEKMAHLLANQGLNVLLVDLRGQDEFDREKITTGMMLQDFNAIVRTFKAGAKVTGDLGVLGASCSVDFAFRLAETNADIVAIAANSGTTDKHHKLLLTNRPGLSYLGIGSAKDEMMIKYSGDWKLVNAAGEVNDIRTYSNHPLSRSITYEQKGHANELFELDPKLEGEITQWFVEVLLNGSK